MMRFPLACAILAVLAVFAGRATAADPTAADLEFFEKKIRPLLDTHCYECHAKGKREGGLSLASRESMLKGGNSTQPAVVPGDPDASPLIEAVRQKDILKMPKKYKLKDEEIADLVTWIKHGAPWPATPAGGADVALRTNGDTIGKEERAFWSFRPVADPKLPAVKDKAWCKQPLDYFIFTRQEEKGLHPVAPADKRTLIRRATFDLIGLPPTPEEIDTFLADDSADAYAKVVDRLLASPHYGERWARHWLDVARYGEDQAHTFQARLFPNGYRYRDWVIKAFQDDLPYDRFVTEQIAGDLLVKDGDTQEHLPALGYFALGPHYYQDQGVAASAAELDDRIDVLTRGFLGLTVSCARCHDHKFDPITTKDYYALAGVFKSTNYVEQPIGNPEEIQQFNEAQAKIKVCDARVKEFLDVHATKLAEAQAGETAKYLVAAWKYQNQRKSNPELSTADFAKAENLTTTVLDRWLRYLGDKGNAAKPGMAEYLKALAEVQAGDTDAPDKVTKAAEAYQAELQAVLKVRDELAALSEAERKEHGPLAKAKADWLQDLFSAQGVFRMDARQVEGKLSKEAKLELAGLKGEVDQAKKAPALKVPFVHTLTEGQVENMKVYLRGNPKTEGDLVERRFLRILCDGDPKAFTQGSGRLELARAIADPKNPLTARVMVNRIWQRHFGVGIVPTPSNFGKLGQKPTHPELLDHLASRFVAEGWSVKKLHREIMLSATYQLGSRADDADQKVDAANQYYWRMNRRRLDVEAWRDALLSVAGNLDPRVGGPSMDLNAPNNHRRTLYGSVSRHNLNPLLRLFDFPDPNLTAEKRPVTIVPVQQLFVLNSDFMVEQARGLVKQLADEKDDAAKIRKAFLRLYGRPANEREMELGLDFLAAPEPSDEPKPKLSRWEQYAQVLLATNEFTFVD
jgi:hypothetical protein